MCHCSSLRWSCHRFSFPAATILLSPPVLNLLTTSRGIRGHAAQHRVAQHWRLHKVTEEDTGAPSYLAFTWHDPPFWKAHQRGKVLLKETIIRFSPASLSPRYNLTDNVHLQPLCVQGSGPTNVAVLPMHSIMLNQLAACHAFVVSTNRKLLQITT